MAISQFGRKNVYSLSYSLAAGLERRKFSDQLTFVAGRLGLILKPICIIGCVLIPSDCK